MNTQYELWLDESGNFENQTDLRWNPSLVGGVLIEQSRVEYSKIIDFFYEQEGHACEIKEDKAIKILTALQFIKGMGGNLVCFENKERESEFTSRELYLRIFASGIVQLLRDLAVKEKAFTLNILVALRVDTKARNEHGENQIPDEEYLEMMREYVRTAVKQQTLQLPSNSEVNIVIGSARREKKLSFADYVCNARLTRTSRQFSDEQRRELEELFSPEYLYGTTEQLTESWIKTYLAEENVASALLELHITKEKIDYEYLLEQIFIEMREISYRVVKIQLQGFLDGIRRYVACGYDFEETEAILEKIVHHMIPKLIKEEIPYAQEFKFDICLYLSDMYLREGDIINAREILEELKCSASELDYKLEHILRQYQAIEKQALYDINCFDYRTASEKMGRVADFIEGTLEILSSDAMIVQTLSHAMQSEYLGDALCMKIYADMFRQRQAPSMYQNMIIDSDKALNQYKYEGELERNLQYRGHIEMEQGNYEEAFSWLLRAAQIKGEAESFMSNCVNYLKKALNEDVISQCYYLMYYCEIMSEAMLHKQVEFANSMYDALVSQREVWDFLEDNEEPDVVRLEREEYNPVYEHSNILEGLFDQIKTPMYHPMEIVYWKIGTYQSEQGNMKAAKRWYTKALNICSSNNSYLVLEIVSLGIISELIYYSCNREEYELYIKQFKKRYKKIISTINIPEVTYDFVKQFEILLKCNEKEELASITYRLSRLITF